MFGFFLVSKCVGSTCSHFAAVAFPTTDIFQKQSPNEQKIVFVSDSQKLYQVKWKLVLRISVLMYLSHYLPCSVTTLCCGTAASSGHLVLCLLPSLEVSQVIWHLSGCGSQLQDILKVDYAIWLIAFGNYWATSLLFHVAVRFKTNLLLFKFVEHPFITQILVMIKHVLGIQTSQSNSKGQHFKFIFHRLCNDESPKSFSLSDLMAIQFWFPFLSVISTP